MIMASNRADDFDQVSAKCFPRVIGDISHGSRASSVWPFHINFAYKVSLSSLLTRCAFYFTGSQPRSTLIARTRPASIDKSRENVEDAMHSPELPRGPPAASYHKAYGWQVQQPHVRSATASSPDLTAYLFGDASLWSGSELGVDPHPLQSEP